MITYERSTLDEQRKVYWSRRSSSNGLGSGDGFQWQGSHGIHLGNESRNHFGILCRTARNVVGNFRRRNLGRLALRSAQAACCKLVVCNPRKNALLKHGNKSDRIDAFNRADLLRLNRLESVYQGETSVRMLRELARSYLTTVKDLSRVMNRLKALYRSWAIPCAGRDVYYTRHRSQWLEKIPEAGTRRRAEQLYQQLDMLQHLRQQARRELLAEGRKHAITAKLREIPSLGPIRCALAVALIQTPHRFRTKRQLWTYSGLGLETRDSGEYHIVQGQPRKRKKQAFVRGLNKDYNHDLKGLFKGAATRASVQPGPFQEFYRRSLAKGIKPTMVRLTLARKIAAITLTLGKKGENFDAEKLKSQAA